MQTLNFDLPRKFYIRLQDETDNDDLVINIRPFLANCGHWSLLLFFMI